MAPGVPLQLHLRLRAAGWVPEHLAEAQASSQVRILDKRHACPSREHSLTGGAGGRNSGTIKSADDVLDLKTSLPTGLGGKGDTGAHMGTNPEQLFAAGYRCCCRVHASPAGRRWLPLSARAVQ